MVSLFKIKVFVILTIFNSFVICKDEKILTRKRRYLTFPEESTLQLVYDQIIGMVDYTNLFILGITCAMAWQLPSEPYDENFLRNQFSNDNDTIRRNDEDVSDGPVVEDIQNYNSIDTNSWNQLLSSQNNVTYSAPWDDNTRKNFYYENTEPIRKPTKKHLVYAAIGKRSIPATNKFDRFYLNHHRTSRHTIYRKIEKYLTARGLHGPECLRKAICETGKKKSDQTPASFVGELMRVIFSLPPPNEDTIHSTLMEREYDLAYDSKFNCTEIYQNCKDSLWTADFI